MFCMMSTVMAVGQCSVIMRPPKPMVTWTSMENRKAEVNDLRTDGHRRLQGAKGLEGTFIKAGSSSDCFQQFVSSPGILADLTSVFLEKQYF